MVTVSSFDSLGGLSVQKIEKIKTIANNNVLYGSESLEISDTEFYTMN